MSPAWLLDILAALMLVVAAGAAHSPISASVVIIFAALGAGIPAIAIHISRCAMSVSAPPIPRGHERDPGWLGR